MIQLTGKQKVLSLPLKIKEFVLRIGLSPLSVLLRVLMQFNMVINVNSSLNNNLFLAINITVLVGVGTSDKL